MLLARTVVTVSLHWLLEAAAAAVVAAVVAAVAVGVGSSISHVVSVNSITELPGDLSSSYKTHNTKIKPNFVHIWLFGSVTSSHCHSRPAILLMMN